MGCRDAPHLSLYQLVVKVLQLVVGWIQTTCRQKLQKKETRRGFANNTPGLKSLYNGGGQETLIPLTKVVIILQNTKSPFSFHHLINQSPNPHLSCPGDCFEFLPGVPVNCDDHLHPLVLGICRFPPTSRSCTSPCFLCHSCPSFLALSPSS